jgi:hypothetical protein
MSSNDVGLARRDDLGCDQFHALYCPFVPQMVREGQVLHDHKMIQSMREIDNKYKIGRKNNGIKIKNRV